MGYTASLKGHSLVFLCSLHNQEDKYSLNKPKGSRLDANPLSAPPTFTKLMAHMFTMNLSYAQKAGSGWLGRAMLLGSFQCRGVLLLWHMVGQGPAVLAAGLFFISSFSNVSSLWRRLDILKYCGLSPYNPMVVVIYYWRRARLVLVNCLVGLSLPRNIVNG